MFHFLACGSARRAHDKEKLHIARESSKPNPKDDSTPSNAPPTPMKPGAGFLRRTDDPGVDVLFASLHPTMTAATINAYVSAKFPVSKFSSGQGKLVRMELKDAENKLLRTSSGSHPLGSGTRSPLFG
jgi:hypothetical protein